MALQTLNTIKQWFRTGLKPTQAQFWDTWDSFRHKFEKIPVKDIDGIDELLLSQADKTVLDNHLADKSAHAPQVNTDWNSESGFSQLLNKPEFRTVNGQTIVGTGDIAITTESADLQSVLDNGSYAKLENKTVQIYNHGANPLDYSQSTSHPNFIQITNMKNNNSGRFEVGRGFANIVQSTAEGNTTTVEFEDNFSETGNKVNIKFPSKPTGDYTLSTTSDFKTINGESIVGEGNLDIEPQGLKSVLDADSTASYGESKATLMGDYGTSKFNEIIVSDETEKTGIYQLKNQLSFDHTVLDSNDIGNITLSEGNVILTRDKSNNQTVVDISDPVANTQLRFPAKSEDGKTYTIATTDDFKTINGESIVGSGDILINGGDGNIPTLQEVLDKDRNATNASINLLSEDGESQTTVHDGGLNISEKTETGFLITDINKLGVSVSKDEETTFVNVLADELSLNKNLSGNPVKQGIVLNEDSSGASKIKLPLTSDGDVKILATTEDFKTINGETIVGEGDITIEGGGNQNLQSVVDLGGRVSKEGFNFLDILEGSSYDRHIWGSVNNGNNQGSSFAIWNNQSYFTNTSGNVDGRVGVYEGKAQMTRTRSGGGSSNTVTMEFDAVNPTYDATVLIPVPKTWGTYRLTLADDFKTINGESIVGTGDMAIGGTSPDATTTVKGVVKLTGDLGGTADTPTTPTALHKTGNESWSGQKGFNSSETILSTFSGIQSRSNSDLVRLDTGFNNAGGTLLNIQSAGGNSPNNTSKLLVLNSGELSVGMPFTVSKAGVVKATIDKEGDVTGSKFVKTGGLPTQFLKADGSIDSNVYANDVNLVHKTGNLTESIDGYKTFLTRTVFNDQTQFGSLITFTNASQVLPSAIVPSLARYDGGIAFLGTGSSDTKFTLTSNNIHTGIFKYVMPDISGTLALKSDIPTNIITGTGAANYIPKFTLSGVMGNSSIYDNGNVLIGTTTDNGAKLQVNGNAKFAGTITASPATLSTELVTKAQLDTVAGTSGSYTPSSITAGGNVSDINLQSATYIRIGNIVQVMCSVNFKTISANTQSNFTIDAPFTRAANIITYHVGSGYATLSTSWNVNCQAYFLGGNNKGVRVDFTSGNGTGNPTYCVINYQYDVTK